MPVRKCCLHVFIFCRYNKRMAGKKLELDRSGWAVAANVARQRGVAGLNYTELSGRLADLGRDIPPLAVRRIEEGQRRVDVDDLMALAMALDISPVALLMPELDSARQDDPVDITGSPETLAAQQVWEWLTAQAPLLTNLTLLFVQRSWPTWERDAFIQQLIPKRRKMLGGAYRKVADKDIPDDVREMLGRSNGDD
ncbi:hypothetical protein AU189_13385 [Mycolicibacterium acapulense]|nr:hypothetical protein AU189_13385 [Mycolicibacterium acapulense]